MHAIHGAAQEVESARAAIVLIAAVLVIFWRLVLRVLLAIIAIAVMVLVGSGAIVLLQTMHRCSYGEPAGGLIGQPRQPAGSASNGASRDEFRAASRSVVCRAGPASG
jgi:hypothetical protein